jgi:hypothetical protein
MRIYKTAENSQEENQFERDLQDLNKKFNQNEDERFQRDPQWSKWS